MIKLSGYNKLSPKSTSSRRHWSVNIVFNSIWCIFVTRVISLKLTINIHDVQLQIREQIWIPLLACWIEFWTGVEVLLTSPIRFASFLSSAFTVSVRWEIWVTLLWQLQLFPRGLLHSATGTDWIFVVFVDDILAIFIANIITVIAGERNSKRILEFELPHQLLVRHSLLVWVLSLAVRWHHKFEVCLRTHCGQCANRTSLYMNNLKSIRS